MSRKPKTSKKKKSNFSKENVFKKSKSKKIRLGSPEAQEIMKLMEQDPDSFKDMVSGINGVAEKFQKEHGRMPTEQELIEHMGLDESMSDEEMIAALGEDSRAAFEKIRQTESEEESDEESETDSETETSETPEEKETVESEDEEKSSADS